MRTIRGKGLVHAEDARMLMVINFWGFTFLFTKLGLQSLDPLSFANLRVASAALALVAMAAF
ncbi:MAG: hypothetical protein KGY38_08485, partial [Desulfobacterales bacterium]|nr:hypothetical protein [Desulfobacterales bacterium]